VNRNRDSSTIVDNANPSILGDGHVDHIAETCECFVYGVVYDFVDEVVETAGAGRTDVHTGALANGL
jgi:hypothetical protein